MRKIIFLNFLICALTLAFHSSFANIPSNDSVDKSQTSFSLTVSYSAGKADCKLVSETEGITYVYIIDDEGEVWGRMTLNLLKGENNFVVDATNFPIGKKFAILSVHLGTRENATCYFTRD